jgi:hypothetical protein
MEALNSTRSKRNAAIKIIALILAFAIPFLIVLILKVLGVTALTNTFIFLGVAFGSSIVSFLIILLLLFYFTRIHDGRMQGKAELHVMKNRLGVRREISRDEAKAKKAEAKAKKAELAKELYALKKDELHTKEAAKVNKYID